MLPVNTMPTYTLQLVSDKKKVVSYKPWLVKASKAMLIAQESGDDNTMIDTIKDVVDSCLVTKLDVNTLPTFDFEYLFLKLREVSVGEMVRLRFFCDVDHGPDNVKAVVVKDIDIRDVKVVELPNHVNTIPLFDKVSIRLKYPTIDSLKVLSDDKDELENMFDMVAECIEGIYDDDQKFDPKDLSKEELLAFLNSLTPPQFDKIQNFFDTAPRLQLPVEYDCPVCKKHHTLKLEGLRSFF